MSSAEVAQEEIPEEGEVVIVTVREITDHGAYVTLDEYDNLRAFLHKSEITTGWVKHIERYVNVGQKAVLKVVRVNRARRQVDLSLRQVSGEERKEKLIQVKKGEKARGILEMVKHKAKLSDADHQKYTQMLADEFGSTYDALEEIARNGADALKKLDFPANLVEVLAQTSKEKIVFPTVTVKGIMEISIVHPSGINIIKDAVGIAQSVKTGGSKITVIYLGAPKYRIAVEAENYKIAEKALDQAVEKARDAITKKGGKFSFGRLDRKKGVEQAS